MLRAASNSKADSEVYNLGSSEFTSLKDLAMILVETYGSGSFEMVPFPPGNKAIDIGDYYTDFRKIRGALGWEPAVPLGEGIRKTVDFYSLHGQHYWGNGK